MARPQAFDREQVHDAIMAVFWRQGFTATTITDLQTASGLARQSLYNSFGDKDALFQTAFERYCRQRIGQLTDPLATQVNCIVAFRQVFDAVVATAVADDLKRGCMMVNTATELVTQPDGVRDSLISAEKEIEDAFTHAIERGQQQGQIASNKNPRKLAMHLYNSIIGLQIRARYTQSRLSLQAIADQALQALR